MRFMYATLVSLLLLGGWLHAQDRNSVQIRIDKDGNGSSIIIDDEEIYVDGVNLEDILEEVEDALEDVGDAIPRNLRDKIVIQYDGDEAESFNRNGFNFNFEWNDDDDDGEVYRISGRPLLGVYLGEDGHSRDENECSCGVRVSKVTRGGAAEQAGIRSGDRITFIDDYEINSEDDLVRVKRNYQPGDRVRVDYLRNGQMYMTNATFQGERNSYTSTPTPRPTPSPRRKKAYLGVYPTNVNSSKASCMGLSDNDGVYLNGVTSHGGAKAAGLQKGDVIMELNGQDLDDVSDMTEELARYSAGDQVRVKYFRDGEWRYANVTLGDEDGISGYAVAPRAPQAPRAPRAPQAYGYNSGAKAFLGVTLDEVRGDGIEITGVSPNTAASVAGLRRGDIIILMDNEEIDDYDDLKDVLSDHRPGDQIRVGYIRDNRPSRMMITLGEKGVPMYAQNQGTQWQDQRQLQDREAEVIAEMARERAERARTEALEQVEIERLARERERIERERERLEREQDRLRIEQERLTRERERMERLEEREERAYQDRDREYTQRPRQNDSRRDMAFAPSSSRAQDDSELSVADRLIQEIEGRRTDDNKLRSFIDNPTLSIRDFEVFPNPNQGRFRLAFETEDRGEIRIYILDSKGEQVYQEVLVNFQGRYDSDIDMTRRIPAGTYYIMLVQDERVMVEPLEVN